MKGSRPITILLVLLAFPGAVSRSEDAVSSPSLSSTLSSPERSPSGRAYALNAPSQPAAKPFVPSAADSLRGRIDAILNGKHLRSTEWSISIQDVASGQTIYSRNPAVSLAPASNRKLFVSALALDRLGPDFRFETRLYLDGEKCFGNRFNGDLVVIASGDPTFSARWSKTGRSDERLREWADFILAENIAHIRNVAIDVSGFPVSEKYPEGWKNDQLDRSYSAPVSAFSFNENVVTVSVAPGAKVGTACRVRLEPVDGDFRIENRTRTVPGSESAIVASRQGDENAIEIRGTLGCDAEARSMAIAVADPFPFAGEAVVRALESRGVRVAGTWKIRETPFEPTSDTIRLPSSFSPPIREILEPVNRDSNNFIAEHLYKAVALYAAGNGSYAAAREVENDFLRKAGIDPQAASFYDGCGLSRLNRVNSETVVALLKYVSRQPYAAVFEESLSVSGGKGGLRHRLSERPARGRLRAKTGFIQGVSALSGYLDCGDGSRAVFSMIANFPGGAYPRIKAQDDICREILRQPLPKPKSGAYASRVSGVGRANVAPSE